MEDSRTGGPGFLRDLREIAEATPEKRNRAADFYRAAAILLVVGGHWLVVAPFYADGELSFGNLLAEQRWTQYATWVFQVMPVFFMVGGFANAASWRSALREPEKRRAWQSMRLRRLLLPTVPLVIAWSVAAAIARAGGMGPEMVTTASQAALVPVWFLAVYIMVTVAVPVTTAVWARAGLWSVAGLAGAAVIVDIAGLGLGQGWLRWANYGFIWVAVHQLGYAWYDRKLTLPRAMALIAAGFAALALLVGVLGYPVSMVSVPGAEVSNSRPPTVALLALGSIQAGAMLLLEQPVRRWLRRVTVWMAVILVSRSIMTVYLWHISALIALIGVILLIDPGLLGADPASAGWWMWRPPWFAALIAMLAPLVALFRSLEAGARRGGGRAPGAVRAVAGATLACAALVILSLHGTGAPGGLGFNAVPLILVLAGVALSVWSGPRARTG